MKLVRFEAADGRVHCGEWLDGGRARVVPGGLFAAAGGAAGGEVLTVRRLLAPVEPPNIFAIGLNYRRHAAETGAELPSAPLVFLKATTAVLDPDAAIVLPRQAPSEVDFEAELAIVIGRSARRVEPAAALSHVLGYCCANDVSARDCQKRIDRQWARGKSFDTFCPLGPWIVTADELPAPDRCAIRCRVNGAVMQESTTADMIFPCAELISYLSHQFTLRPGTVILTGTPEGVGTARKPPVYLRPGDRVSVEIEGIGVLENGVEADAG
ncbi:MAG: fumarylacetoacetate hydrolase family protein [Phycisphaerales bacterium]|nr:fumarylacetoacetate hydrolase family protein [Phycisphaerales bacterium]